MTRLSTGDPAPDFTLPTDDGRTVSLADSRGRKTIVYFYPAAMTPGCTTQACDFTDSLSSLQAAGYGIVGLFVLAWVIALAVWRFGRIEERWSSDLAN